MEENDINDTNIIDDTLTCPECGAILSLILFQCHCSLCNCLQTTKCICNQCKVPNCNKADCIRGIL
jgi:hypothetical protein